MQLEVVNIEDVFPDENNPRQKFEGIDELAESFDLNKERPGEPFTPPILVRDGGIYRIVDGERRYKALKKRRKTSFTANVCEDMDEANTLVAMLATDDKQPLSDLEKSRGVQQMLLLGVDPVQVDKTIKGSNAKRIKRAMDRVQDAAEDMTLDRLLAIDEFSDDPEVVENLTNCDSKFWETIADNARRERKSKQRMKEIKEELEKRGYHIVDERPEGYYYSGCVRSIKNIDSINGSPDGVVLMVGYGNQSYEVLKYRQGESNNEVIAEIKRLKDEIAESEEIQQVWFGEHMDDPDSMPHVVGIVVDEFINRHESVIDRFKEDLQIDMKCSPCKLVLAVGYDIAHQTGVFCAEEIQEGKFNKWSVDRATSYLSFIDAMISDGYKPEEWEKKIFDRWHDALKSE